MTGRFVAVLAVVCATFSGVGDAAAQRSNRQWGALAYTQDGGFSAGYEFNSRIVASDKTLGECEKKSKRGDCQVVEIPGDSCAALATYVGPDPDKRNRFSRPGIGDSIEVAERLAMINTGCKSASDRSNCEIKVSFCADGRGVQAIQQPKPRERADFVPPPSGIISPRDAITRDKAPLVPSPGQSAYYGAIAFTADGSWATTWKAASKLEAEADVAKRCAKLGHGGCEVVSFTGDKCVGLATFIGRSGRRRWQLSFTAGADTGPEAQRAAVDRCNSDERARGRCQLRTMVCGDGR